MTNGEKMQEMFPEGKTRRCRGGVVFESDGWCHAYDSDWWNKEHKEPTIKNDLEVDCISRNAVLGLPRKTLRNYFGEVTVEAIDVKDIMGLPSLTPKEPRWIPVSENLPEENKTVIASTKYGVYPEARYSKEDGWEWAYESGADYWEEIACYVLAWMPLPKPYKAESEEV